MYLRFSEEISLWKLVFLFYSKIIDLTNVLKVFMYTSLFPCNGEGSKMDDINLNHKATQGAPINSNNTK